uniref:Uncharacterized protein n=1 Tax=Candidatus Nitrotoga fabula TaxID=2182327 RepID=A0A2X0SLH8_9PROT|nr:protein of unknown function [Candidatus Nitrotoga fabula]
MESDHLNALSPLLSLAAEWKGIRTTLLMQFALPCHGHGGLSHASTPPPRQ